MKGDKIAVLFRRLRPLQVEYLYDLYTKCPQPIIKRDGLRRMGGKGYRKYHVAMPTHLEHCCALALKLKKIIYLFYFV